MEHLRIHRRTGAIALVLLAASAPVAVASSAPLTKAQVIKRGSAVCRAAEHRVDATPGPRSQNPFAKTAPKGDRERALKFMAVYASSLSSVRRGFIHLAPRAPLAGRSLLTSFAKQLRPTIAAFRAGRAAALSHHYARALRQVQRGFALFDRASAKTKAYGFPKGVCQAGSS
jgi:hypothetical protein